jgi:hypothetical protein
MKIFIAAITLLPLILMGCADPATETATAPTGDTASAATELAAESAQAAAPLDAPIDFRGTWILNTDLGENLGMMKAVNETIIATQTDTTIVFDMADVFAGMTTTRTITYDANGQTMQNEAAMGAKSETVSTWEDGKLVTIWTAEGAISGTTTARTETRWLAEDGKTLSVSMSRDDNPAMVFVFEKAE